MLLVEFIEWGCATVDHASLSHSVICILYRLAPASTSSSLLFPIRFHTHLFLFFHL